MKITDRKHIDRLRRINAATLPLWRAYKAAWAQYEATEDGEDLSYMNGLMNEYNAARLEAEAAEGMTQL